MNGLIDEWIGGLVDWWINGGFSIFDFCDNGGNRRG
jgi:hypothetical protein